MGFHKRYINDDQVISLYQNGGVDAVIVWYTGKVDALDKEQEIKYRQKFIMH